MFDAYITQIKQDENIDSLIVDYIASSHKKFIYGAGLQASVCLGIFRDMKLPIEAIIVPHGSDIARLNGYWGELISSAKKIRLNDFAGKEKDADILMAIDRTEYPFAKTLLNGLGFPNVYPCCWKRNIHMKSICYRVYRETHPVR